MRQFPATQFRIPQLLTLVLQRLHLLTGPDAPSWIECLFTPLPTSIWLVCGRSSDTPDFPSNGDLK